MFNRIRNYKGNRVALGIIVGIASATVLCVAMSCILAMLVLKGYLTTGGIGIATVLLQAVGTCIGSAVAASIAKERKVAAMIASVCGFFVMLLCVGMLIFDGISANAYMGLLGCLAGAAAALLLQLKGKGARKPKRRTVRSR